MLAVTLRIRARGQERSAVIRKCVNSALGPRGLQLCVWLSESRLVTLAQQVMIPQITAVRRRIKRRSKLNSERPLEQQMRRITEKNYEAGGGDVTASGWQTACKNYFFKKDERGKVSENTHTQLNVCE